MDTRSLSLSHFMEQLARGLEHVQATLIAVSALVIAADDLGFHAPQLAATSPALAMQPLERLFALIRTAGEKCSEMAARLDDVQEQLTTRALYDRHLRDSGEPGSVLARAVDEALFVLESAGVAPLVVLLNAEERARLGADPWTPLLEQLERVRTILSGATIAEAGQAYRLLESALGVARTLAHGAAHVYTPEVAGTN